MNDTALILNLTNGMRCVLVKTESPVSVASLWVSVGSRNDPHGKEGLAHIFEHLFMTETARFCTEQERFEYMEPLGIVPNAFTSRERTCFYNIQPKERTLESVGLLLEGFSSTKFNPERLEQEKKVILDEESRNKDDISNYFWRLRDRVLWGDSSLGRDFYGNKKSISSITLDDILDFKNLHYQSKHVTLVIIGDVSQDAIERLVKDHASRLPEGGVSLKTDDAVLDLVASDPQREVFFEKRDVSHATLGIYYKTVPAGNVRDTALLEYVRDCFANTWSSRLVKKLRLENKLTYWVDGESDNFLDVGYVGFRFSCSNDDVSAAFRVAIAEIEENHIFDSTEMKRHLDTFIAATIRNNVTPQQLLWWYGNMALTPGVRLQTPQEYVKDFANIRPSDIRELMDRFLKKENRTVAIVGPQIPAVIE